MPFSGTIDPATPLGTDPVSEGDNQLRALKLALVERLTSMVDDIDTDPLHVLGKAYLAIAEISTLRMNGTAEAPAAVEADQVAGGLTAYAWGDTGKQKLAQILGVARELITDSESGGLWRVSATKVGTNTQIDLFDIQGDNDDNLEIVAEKSIRFKSKNSGDFDFAGALTELSKRVVTTGFATDDGQPEIYNAGDLGGGVVNIDWSNGPVQRVRLTGPGVLTFSNPVEGGTYMLLVVQNGVGGHEPSLTGWDFGTAAPVTWAPDAGQMTLVSALYYNSVYIAGVGHIDA